MFKHSEWRVIYRKDEDRLKTKSEIIKRRTGALSKESEQTRTEGRFSEDPFAETDQFNFKKSKSDKKMIETVWEKENEDVFDTNDKFDNKNILSSQQKKEEGAFDFDDNFADFGKSKGGKEKADFGFDDANFGDQFGNDASQKAEEGKGKDDFNFDFGGDEERGREEPSDFDNKVDFGSGNDKEDEDPFGQQAPSNQRRNTNPSGNLDFHDPFASNDNQESGSKGAERPKAHMDNDSNTMEDPFAQNSAQRKK